MVYKYECNAMRKGSSVCHIQSLALSQRRELCVCAEELSSSSTLGQRWGRGRWAGCSPGYCVLKPTLLPPLYICASISQSINLVFHAISIAFMIVSWNNLAALFFPNNNNYYIKDIFLFEDGVVELELEATTCWFSVIVITGDFSNFDLWFHIN